MSKHQFQPFGSCTVYEMERSPLFGAGAVQCTVPNI